MVFKTVNEAAEWAEQAFTEANLFFGHGTDNAWDEAIVLILHVLAISPYTNEDVLAIQLTPAQSDVINALFERRIKEKVPAAYLIEEAWFCGIPFHVDKRVIIPRSPIAELIENQFYPWVESEKVHAILDLCTGSGCIAIASALYFPEAKVDAIDIDADALAVAKINVEHYELDKQVRLIKSDLFNELTDEKYDIIVSNPPYVDAEDFTQLPSEFLHEPALALASGNDGLDATRHILKHAANYLNDEGILIVEVGNSAVALEAAFPDVPFTWLSFEYGGDGVFLLTKEQLCDLNQAQLN